MNKLIIGIVLCFFSLLAKANVQVEVRPDQVNLGESFQLILTQESQQTGGVPELSDLRSNFVILGSERNVNYSVINGQAQSSSQWIITLRALRAGILTIPAIKIGQEETSPLTINVSASTKPIKKPDTATTSQEIFLTTKVSEPNPYINQQVIYTVALYNSQRLLDAEYQGPQVDNALLVPLGDVKRYQRLYNNVDYIVEEQSYAIYPQKSGSLTIKSPIFTALVYDFNPRRVKSQDKPINLTVKPIPKQFDTSNWLPAKQVSLKERYERTEQTISQGSTLTRTVTLEGVGIPAQLLPTLNFAAADSFSVYPEKGVERNVVRQGQLIGSTEVKVTYLFNKAGKITIPELRLAWFNTDTGKEEAAVLAPRSFDVTPSATSSNEVHAPKQPIKESDVKPTIAEKSTVFGSQHDWLAWALAAFFAFAWLITLGLLLWRSRPREVKEGKGQYNAALGRLRKACKENNPESAREALLKWAALHWPDAHILNLSDVMQLVKGTQLKKQLHLLTQVLYSNIEKTWQGEELWRAVAALKQGKARKKQKAEVLPPINPE